MNLSHVASEYLFRRHVPASLKPRLQQTLAKNIVDDERNHLSFYQILKRNKSTKKGFDPWIKKQVSSGQVLLLSEIYQGMHPSLNEAIEQEDNRLKEENIYNQKLLQELDYWKQTKSFMNLTLLDNFRILQDLPTQRIDSLRQIFSYNTTILKEKVQKSIGELELIMEGKSFHEKELAYHYNSEQLEESMLKAYQNLRKNKSILQKEIVACKEEVGSISECIQELSNKKQKSNQAYEYYLKQLANKREYVLLISAMEKVIKRNRFILKDLFSMLADYYRQLLLQGKDLLMSGLRPIVLKLLYLRQHVTTKDLYKPICDRTKESIIRCSEKELQVEMAIIELQNFSALLVRLFTCHEELLHLYNFGNIIKKNQKPEDKGIMTILKKGLYRKVSNHEGLWEEAQTVIMTSGIKGMCQDDIIKAVEQVSIVKLNIEKEKKSQQNILLNHKSHLDPVLTQQIASNQLKMNISKRTTAQLIRTQTIRRIKRWYPKDNTATPEMIVPLKSRKKSRILTEKKAREGHQIALLMHFIQTKLFSVYNRLQERLEFLKNQLRKLEEIEIHALIEDHEGPEKAADSFLLSMTIFVGEARGLEVLKKRPMIREYESLHETTPSSFEYTSRVPQIYRAYASHR